MSGSCSPTRVSTTDQAPAADESVAEEIRRRVDAIRDDIRARGRAPRYAEPPECDLPESLTRRVTPKTAPPDDQLDADERRYMEKLRARKLGEAEAAVLVCLDEGRANARKSRKIEELTELSPRAVRSAVETLRLNEFPICSATGGRKRSQGDAGYWLAATGEEFVACIRSNRRRALQQLAVTGAMKRAAAELFGQTVFELGEAVA